MKLASIVINLFLVVGLAVVVDAAPGLTTTTSQSLDASATEFTDLDKRYPVSFFNRTSDTPQGFCSDTRNLTVVADEFNHNVTIRNCEALRDMYASDTGAADGNGYWDYTFSASDRNDTDGLAQFTVDFNGDCELKVGLLYYSKVPLDLK